MEKDRLSRRTVGRVPSASLRAAIWPAFIFSHWRGVYVRVSVPEWSSGVVPERSRGASSMRAVLNVGVNSNGNSSGASSEVVSLP